MLSGLAAVDWTALSHAHGVAVDVPDQLRAVAEGGRAEAEQALYELYGSLWNDGRTHSATAAAIPFLVEIAAAGEVEPARRVDVLVLLARIGAASAGAAADRQRVAEHLDASRSELAPLLDAPDPDLRAAAAGLAGAFSSPPRAWARRLREMADSETDPVVAAHYSVAAALADGRQPDLKVVDLAASHDPYLWDWKASRLEGLAGLRVSKRAALDLSMRLTELALERV